MRWVILALGLAACEMAPPAPLAACGAAGLGLIGQPVSMFPATGGWTSLRIIHPGDPVTEDFSPTRLNVYLDDSGIIQSMTCG